MTSTTVRQLIQEAVAKGLDWRDDLTHAKDAALEARDAYNLLRGELNSDEIEQSRDAAIAQVASDSKSSYDKAVAVASVKQERATALYIKEVQSAQDTHDAAIEAITAEWEEKVLSAQRELNLRASSAQAEAYTADQKVAAIQAEIDKHLREAKEEWGIDLQSLVEFGNA